MPASAEAEVLASGASVGVVARKIAGRENRGAHGPIAHRGGLAELLEVANIGEHLRKIVFSGITIKQNNIKTWILEKSVVDCSQDPQGCATNTSTALLLHITSIH